MCPSLLYLILRAISVFKFFFVNQTRNVLFTRKVIFYVVLLFDTVCVLSKSHYVSCISFSFLIYLALKCYTSSSSSSKAFFKLLVRSTHDVGFKTKIFGNLELFFTIVLEEKISTK